MIDVQANDQHNGETTVSKPGDFDRIDRPELRGTDPMAEFRSKTDAQIAYRDAYFALARRDPGAIAGLPHPDTAPDDFDAAAALTRLRDAQSKLKAVPPREVQS